MLNLQLFAEAVHGSKLVYLFRLLSDAVKENGTVLAFTTENGKTISKDSDSTATKDGAIRTPGEPEIEITATALLAKGDTMVKKLQKAMLDNELVEIWEANLEEKAGDNTDKFSGTYYQGYVTECETTSNAEDYVEVSLTFAINGTGAEGEVTVSAEQQEVAAYVFKDTTKMGA